MQLQIVSNPHTKNPDRLIKELEKAEKELLHDGKDRYSNPKFDANGFERLRLAMVKNPRIKVK